MIKEVMQMDCGNMISTEEGGAVIQYSCKYYAISPPPCHMKPKSPTFIDLFECEHRIITRVEDYLAQFKKDGEEQK